jgi:hypothetical protein
MDEVPTGTLTPYLLHCKAWCLPASYLGNAFHGIQAVITMKDCEFYDPYLVQSRGLQRDVVYLALPIAPSYMSPNTGGGGGCRVLAN